jgi:hypothetical protein
VYFEGLINERPQETLKSEYPLNTLIETFFLEMNVQRSAAYTALQDQERFSDFSDTEKPKHSQPSSPPRTYRRVVLYLLIGITTIVTSIFIFRFAGTRAIIDQCGTTPSEARAKGCIFEMTGFSWLPEECADRAVETEFLNSKALQYYRDANYTQEVPLEEVRRGDGPGFYVKQDYHLAHCGFLFKKLHKAISQGKKVDGVIFPFHHTAHCVHMLLGPPNSRWDAIQFAFVKFPYCGKSGGYNVEWEKQGEWVD